MSKKGENSIAKNHHNVEVQPDNHGCNSERRALSFTLDTFLVSATLRQKECCGNVAWQRCRKLFITQRCHNKNIAQYFSCATLRKRNIVQYFPATLRKRNLVQYYAAILHNISLAQGYVKNLKSTISKLGKDVSHGEKWPALKTSGVS